MEIAATGRDGVVVVVAVDELQGEDSVVCRKSRTRSERVVVNFSRGGKERGQAGRRRVEKGKRKGRKHPQAQWGCSVSFRFVPSFLLPSLRPNLGSPLTGLFVSVKV